MSKGPVLFLGIGVVFGVLGLGCSSEGKIPFDDDELAPDDSAGQGGNPGSSGSSGSSGASGRGGGAGIPTGGTAGSTAGSGGSAAGSGGSSAGNGGTSGAGTFGRGGTSPSGDPDTVGQSCSQDSTCRSIPGGYCANAGFCTAECTTHVDCGCPPGTVNSDIAAGECSAACVTYDDGSSYCQRTCNSSDECDGETQCEELAFYGVCSPG